MGKLRIRNIENLHEKMTKKVIALFDVDGTLTVPRKAITQEMHDFMQELQKHVTVGIVGGSDYKKITEQLGACSDVPIEKIGEEKNQDLTNHIFKLMADIRLPVKRGTFIELRKGMINVSPIGRQCSQAERDAFDQMDKTAKIRPAMVSSLKEKFGDQLTFSIGGQISFDVFPTGWDKTYCLQFLEEYDEVYFFGDKTFKGGNNYEIFEAERTKGNTVTSPDDTKAQCTKLFML